MKLDNIKSSIPNAVFDVLKKNCIDELRPSQEKAINAGLFDGKSLLVCTPTSSGKTLIAELASLKTIAEKHKKAVYIVPLVALANEKCKEFRQKYPFINISLSIGDFDQDDPKLYASDFIICTAEKLDSLLRHKVSWINNIGTVVIDEIHLLNDAERGPTLEIIITLLKKIIPSAQFIGLSATIGNPQELAEWLDAELVVDDWRPVPLHKGVLHENKIEFFE